MDFMIIRELARMSADMPKKLAQLSKTDVNAAIEILQSWGNEEKPLRDLWKDVNTALEK